MARKKIASIFKPYIPNNSALTNDINDMYSLVSRGLNGLEQQSESNSTLKLLNQLQEEPKSKENGSYYREYNGTESNTQHFNEGNSLGYPKFDQYSEEASAPYEGPDTDAGKGRGEDLIQPLKELAESRHVSTSQYKENTASNDHAIEGSRKLPLSPPKPQMSQKELPNVRSEDDDGTPPSNHVETQTKGGETKNEIRRKLSKYGALPKAGTQATLTEKEAAAEILKNGHSARTEDIAMCSSMSGQLERFKIKPVETTNNKPTGATSTSSVQASANMRGKIPWNNLASISSGTRTETLENKKKEDTSFRSPPNNFLHASGHDLHSKLVDSSSFTRSTESKHFKQYEKALDKTKESFTNTPFQKNRSKPTEGGFEHATLKKKAQATGPSSTGPRKQTFVTSTESFIKKANLNKSAKPGSLDYSSNSPAEKPPYKAKEPSMNTVHEYQRFGRQDLSKGERWVPINDAYASGKSQSYSGNNLHTKPRSSREEENKGYKTHKPRTWAHEGSEPPNKKFKPEPVHSRADSYRPTYSTERKRLGSFDAGFMKPQINVKSFNNQPQTDTHADLKLPGKLRFEMVPYSKQQVEHFLSESLTHPNLKIAYFVQTSQELVSKAHGSLVSGKSSQSVLDYHKFIKAAIKCLLILTKTYKKELTPHQLVSIYYKLAVLYLHETESIDLAEAYATTASSVCRDHSLIELGFFCDLLKIEIYENYNVTMVDGFVLGRVAHYEDAGYHLLASCLQLARIKYLLASDVTLALVNLQRLIKAPKLHPTIKKIALVYVAGLQNYRGDPDIAVEFLKGVDTTKDSQPFVAYVLMTKLLANMNLNSTSEVKHLLRMLMELFNDGTKSNWNQWSVHGDIKFHVKGESDIEFDFVVPWLPVSDFNIMLYFLSGVAYLHSMGDQSKVCFTKALKLIGDAQENLKLNKSLAKYLTAYEARKRNLKLRYYKYLIQYYQQWQSFIDDNSKIASLNEFMNANNKGFNREEITMFTPLFPYINYMVAMYYHSRGDIQAAKFYYLKVRNWTSIVADEPTISLQQMSNGLGGNAVSPSGKFSELYIYSTFHLIILLDYEITEIISKEETEESKQAVEKFSGIRNTLSDEFALASKVPVKADQFQSSFVNTNKLLKITVEIIMRVLKDLPPDFAANELKSMLVKIGDKTTFYFIYFLISYALVFKISGTTETNKVIKRCLDLLPKSKSDVVEMPSGKKVQVSISESVDSCRVFLLRSLMQVHESNGLHSQVDMEKVQLERFYKLLAPRYAMLAENVIYDPTFQSLAQSQAEEKQDVEMNNA
ncbi:hypothetical protein CANMA_004772 [Candida margitis]|uniref:uncharacterized protein n=1 Tax=Candida margitis TaxID=1775924 RepID=UPI002227C091|nr:uncharacterized protein CANMA_004772 [Candida margitis]KAI5953933.1 hypothetical protein CANMA_004772 [Candida margitis]